MKQKETNIPHNPIHNSSFILHNCATVPVYYWRGARPGLIDLEAHQTGWLVCLSL
ncbi:MAG: hypothetical protein GWP17_01555, partial [Aquificales bacterium]|nr:hypothetical protein [Aquificales bacterium]